MGQRIKEFRDGSFLEYDLGAFDDWCVYLTDANGLRKAPRDTDYFRQLKNLSTQYGENKVYADYVAVYDLTGTQVENAVFNVIAQRALSYGENALSVEIMLSVLYLAMIAEERKANMKLGKRIKRLGVHKLLFDGGNVSNSANFMRGMGWREIDALCRQYGF